MIGRVRGSMVVFAVIAMAVLTVGATGAAANTVVNGDFETGTLEGWEQVNQPEPPTGGWTAYSGTDNPFSGPPLIAPPQGIFAASSAQSERGTHILYQDIPIESGQPYLSMLVYYRSEAPFVTPSPDTLDSEGEANQQYRIELIDPSAPIDTVEPADILATVFRSGAGVSATSPAQSKGIDLTKFAGQTVRLRLAEVDNQLYLNAGVDSVATGPVPLPAPPLLPAPTPPSSAFTVGKLKLKKKNGTATLNVTLPGPGTLTATDAKKKSPKRIKKASATSTAAGTVTLKLKPTGAGKKTLMAKGSLKFKATLAFMPSGGTVGTQVLSGKLRMNPTH